MKENEIMPLKSYPVQRLMKITTSSYFQSMLIRVTNAGLALGVSILLARLLGPQEYGRYGILLSFAAILAIPFTAGLPKTLTKEIAVARFHHDHGLIRSLTTLGVKTFLGIIPIVFLISLCLYIANFEIAGLGTGILLAALLAPIVSADANRLAIMRGLGSAVKSQIPDLLVRPLAITAIVIALLFFIGSANAYTGITAYSVATFIGLFVGSIMVRSELKSIPKTIPRSILQKRTFYKSVVTMSLLGSATKLTGNLDMLLLSQLSSFEAAGEYKVALAGLAVVVLGGNAVSAVSFTRLAETIPSGDKAKIASLSDQALKWSLLFTSAVTIIVVFVGRPVIEFFYGTEYLDSWKVLVILSAGFCVAFSFGQAPEVAALTGNQVPAALSILVSIAVTVGVAYYSVASMGAIGIAIASMIGTITRFLLISIVVRFGLGINITIFGLLTRSLKKRRSLVSNPHVEE